MITLEPVVLPEEYRKKWNVNSTNFVNIYKDGIKINDTLYSLPGLTTYLEDDYFLLLKYTEYTEPKNKLVSSWSIFDRNGIEKLNCEDFSPPCLWGGVLVCLRSSIYNIETGYCYASKFSKTMYSKEYFFIDTCLDKAKKKRGIIKINRKTGEFEFFPQ